MEIKIQLENENKRPFENKDNQNLKMVDYKN